ncbi:uncharacterized protein BJ212DRAFT_1301283 [Suillus subaureus]|uniref:Uncharacterized protein n=1 Tax=Suillus subaureus TaxID=48587 RepID=A0A9P7E6J2_9AGAM|nr:uncharacterized protein BJ212DRAFT_1301283 [Suillus subaureus]KAG1812796.1 hypothetical protein BJ212DRAFT_1301283 [Suillus subaureus]
MSCPLACNFVLPSYLHLDARFTSSIFSHDPMVENNIDKSGYMEDISHGGKSRVFAKSPPLPMSVQYPHQEKIDDDWNAVWYKSIITSAKKINDDWNAVQYESMMMVPDTTFDFSRRARPGPWQLMWITSTSLHVARMYFIGNMIQEYEAETREV